MRKKIMVCLLFAIFAFGFGCANLGVRTKMDLPVACSALKESPYTQGNIEAVLTKNVTCSSDNDCNKESIISFCKPDDVYLMNCDLAFYCKDSVCHQSCTTEAGK